MDINFGDHIAEFLLELVNLSLLFFHFRDISRRIARDRRVTTLGHDTRLEIKRLDRGQSFQRIKSRNIESIVIKNLLLRFVSNVLIMLNI